MIVVNLKETSVGMLRRVCGDRKRFVDRKSGNLQPCLWRPTLAVCKENSG